jgi:hypothetical protein
LFIDEAPSSTIGQSSLLSLTFGAFFFDFDLDGHEDIFVANGHVCPQMDLVKGGVPYRQPVLLFRNHRDRTFEDVTALSGLDKLPMESRRGAAFGDVNNDGKTTS